MKNILTRLVPPMFVASILLFTNQNVSAADVLFPNTQVANQSVKSMVESDFVKFQNALDDSKSQFHASNVDSFKNAQLGDGIPYYMVSNVSNSNVNSFTFAGYIFPIHLNGIPAGIVFATEANGKWRVFNIKNSLTFEQDVQDATKLLKSTDHVKLVYDTLNGLYLLTVQDASGDSRILSMKDDAELNLKKNSLVPMANFQAKLKELRSSNPTPSPNQFIQLGGIGADQTGFSKSNAFPMIGVLVMASGLICYLVVRKRKKAL